MALYRHTARGTTPGESWSFGVYTTGDGSLQSAQDAFTDAIAAMWTGNLDAVMTPDVVVTELSTASIASASGTQLLRVTDDVSLPGVATGEMLPFQCATSVSWTADLATRAGRGRIYLPPLAASSLDGGRVSSDAVVVIADAANALWAGLDTGGLALVLYGRTTHTTNAVTGGNVGDVIDTQRRRRNKLIEARTALTAP